MLLCSVNWLSNMSEPVFLDFEVVCEIHEEQLKAFGGTSGIRDMNLAQSAVFQPQNDYFYGGVDLHGIAAAYAFHIAQAQAFLDGNKRTGMAAALVFYRLNGVETSPAWEDLYECMIAIAEKRLDKPGLAQRFRELFRG